jgi:Flp pilus assembly protein TadG
MRPKQSKPAAARHGAAVVEFAVIAPFLTMIALGMIEVTRAIQVKDVLTDAVRSSCRLAILPGSDNAAVTSNINTLLNNAGIPPDYATITIQVNGQTADVKTAVQGDKVAVQLSVPLDKVSWITPLFFTDQSVDSETLTMMRQG